MKYSVKTVLSQGLALGKVHRIDQREFTSIDEVSDYERLDRAIEKSLQQISIMKNKSPELVDYLIVQEFMVGDPDLKKKIVGMLDEGIPVNMAVTAVMQEFINGLKNSESSYLKERANDMEDAARRILMNLSDTRIEEQTEPFILFTDMPYPSYLIHYKDLVLGIVSKTGGFTSHTAILCRSYDIPFVVMDGIIEEGEEVIIDTRKNLVITKPSQAQKASFWLENRSMEKKAVPHTGFNFLANAASDLDVAHAMDYGFDGIGLFRTEMIFMNSNRPFTAIEQYKIYKAAVDKLLDGKSIVFRTFDVGGDKKISYIHANEESVENYKQNPYLFEDQVMAILKIYTDTHKDVRVMFPMIFNPEDYKYLKDWVKNLAARFGYDVPPIGMMLETKEAIEQIDLFEDVDFISVGTNDLVKSLYHMNRETSFGVRNTYIDDLLFRLGEFIKIADKKGIKVSVCGELASIPEVALELYKRGFRNLSVSPSLVAMLNQAYLEFEE